MDDQTDMGFLNPPKRLNRPKLLQKSYEAGLKQGKTGEDIYTYDHNPDLQNMFKEGYNKGLEQWCKVNEEL